MYTHTHVHTNIEKINNFPVFACSLVDPLYLHLHSIPVLYKRAACQINIMMRYEYTSYVCLVQEVSPLHALYSERIVYIFSGGYIHSLYVRLQFQLYVKPVYMHYTTHTHRDDQKLMFILSMIPKLQLGHTPLSAYLLPLLVHILRVFYNNTSGSE